ncbi:MAG: glycosyltransferase family 4 protein [Aquabacterium sp.]
MHSGSLRTRLKVAILLPTHWSHVMGGAEYQCKVLCDQLVADGRFDVHWLSRRFAPGYRGQGYSAVQAGKVRQRLAKGYFLDRPLIERALDRIQPDVIYQRSGSGYTGIAAQWARRHGRRMIWHVASDKDLAAPARWVDVLRSPLRGWDRRWLDRGILDATHVVVQSKEQLAALQRHHGRSDAFLIRNFHPGAVETAQKADPAEVLWIANFKRIKQPDRFVQLARACADLPARFVMMGEPAASEPAWMDPLLADIRATPNLSYLGRLSQEDVNRRLAGARVLVNTSSVEGFSNTFIQAWQRGVPVLSLNADPDGLLSTDDGLGLCVRGDEAALQQTLRAWLSDPARLDRMAGRARAHAHAHHSMVNVTRLIELIEHGRVSATVVPDLTRIVA